MKTFAFLAILFLAAYAVAADGDEYTPREAGRSLYFLCDTAIAADEGTACDTFKAQRRSSETNVYVQTDTACTAYTVAIQESTLETGGDWHTLGTLSFGVTTAIHVDGFTGKYLRADLTTVTDCTDLDIMIEVN